MSFQSIELPYPHDSAELFARIADLPWAAYLDSCQLGAHGSQQGQYDILTALPYVTLRTIGDKTEIQIDPVQQRLRSGQLLPLIPANR